MRRTAWIVGLGVGIPITLMVFMLAGAVATGNWGIARWAGLAGFSGLFGMTAVFTVLPGRRKVLAHKGCVCGNCLFPLEGLGDQGVCPECGHTFDIEKTIQGWQQDLEVRDLGKDEPHSHGDKG